MAGTSPTGGTSSQTTRTESQGRIELDGGGSIRAAVNAEYGAALSSLQWRWDGEWRELLYRADRVDPAPGWRGQAPWLWPAVGRNYTADQLQASSERPSECRWLDGETARAIPIHGFVMDAHWSVLERSPAGALLQLASSPLTRETFPYDFLLQLRVTVDSDAVLLEMNVVNPPGQEAHLPFSIGNHLTLLAPFADGTPLDRAHLSGPAQRIYEVTPAGLEGEVHAILGSTDISLDTPWTANALLGGFTRSMADMCVETDRARVRVGQKCADLTRLGLDAGDYRFVLYRDPEQRFFCLEPWLGKPNSLNSGHGLVRLPPGDSMTWRMSVRLEHKS